MVEDLTYYLSISTTTEFTTITLFFQMYIMNNHNRLMLALLCLVHPITIFTSNVPTSNYPVDSFAISCGSSSRMIAANGRAWLEDVAAGSSSLHTLSGKSMMTSALHHTGIVVDHTPYNTARISHHEFTYTFHVPSGQKFIRLHFLKSAYKGFRKSIPNFSVKAGKFTLLTNFSPPLVKDASTDKTIVKEFCVNIRENQALEIVFSPFVEAKSKDVYAFINGIEIVSMPAGLYFTHDSDLGVEVVGQKYKFYIDNATALELVKRLNIGGNSIPPIEDESMFRGWDSDLESFTHTDSVLINRNVKIQYKDGPSFSYLAPMRVYQSAKTTRPENHLNKHNLTWRISVDSGFRYLVRLHFCELEPAMMKDSERKFSIYINNEIAESNVDLIRWGGGQGVALYRVFVAILEENHNRAEHNLIITLEPKFMSIGKQTEAILNGLEIFKMSNPDNHLTSRSVVHHIQSSTSSWFPKQMRLPSFGTKNVIATMLVSIITTLNIVVYYLRRWSERSSDVRNMNSQCHQFSLDEIRSTTNNFHQEYLIGSGGYGKVYKGIVNSNGGTVVAIKRLKSDSRQGENEFWTEIDMLTKLQHENLVPLVGYCNESQEFLLIYQYMKRGTLDDHLYKIAAKKVFHPPLSWDQRLNIAIGAASGLCYLHEKQVIHRDVKSSNILIDENWVAKISDFGLSRMGPADESLLSHVSTDVKGTIGYLCPEYYQTRMLSFKSDVYAFGVVLLEVLTGRPPVDMQLPDEQYSLVVWAKNCIRNGNVDGIIDPTLLRQIAPACLKKYVGIVQSCLKTVPRERPSMFDVVRHLDSALLSQQTPDFDDVTEVGKIYNDGSTSFDDTTSLIAETMTSITEDDISTESMEQGSYISKSAKHELRAKDLSSNVPSKKWWNVFRYFQKLPKSRNEYGNLSFNEVLVATHNFSNSLDLAYGGSVTVCKGKTDGGKRVVVLRSYMEEETNPTMQELQSILGMSPSGNHAPPASLIGYCVYKPNLILVFHEIDVANRSLHNHLHTPVREPLSWKQRLVICIDAARVHRCLQAVKLQFWDLTSTKILLDERFVPKIDLYSVASRISTNNPLLDSNYIRDEKTNEKSVVFSFGIILFEVLCAGEASRYWFEMDPATVAKWIMPRTNGNFIRHFDPYLIGKISAESSSIYMEIASRCLHPLGRERPTMSEIVSQLEMALQLQQTNNDI